VPAEEARAVPLEGIDPITGLAGEMFGRYLLPFEAVSILLLATAVSVVVLAKRSGVTRARRGAADPAAAAASSRDKSIQESGT
jgi:hypothetical protein